MANDNAKHAELKARLEREEAEMRARVIAEAHAAGKEPLDIAFVEGTWPDNPNAHYEARGVNIPPDRRQRDWERLYYVLFKDMRTNAEFVARMKVLQGEGYFD